ncbi:hypothetical protein [Anatilimnocola floriformis]|uniref:hypothetical protein n=1 Tax=Anatilimnocola floriformis TaxID=2948575 RepID=UPI0020C58420|nr:hypothetical protein [Anatilimnocola floriformis]
MNREFYEALEQVLTDDELAEAGKKQPEISDCELNKRLDYCKRYEEHLNRRAAGITEPFDDREAKKNTSAAFIQSLIDSN